MDLANTPILQGCPIAMSAGYFDPSITMWGEAGKKIDSFTASNIASTTALVALAALVSVLNSITASAKFFQAPGLNNLLDNTVRYAIDSTDALVLKSKRLNFAALEKFTKAERKKIKDIIFQPNNALGTSNPNQLVSSKQVIFDSMSEIMKIPKEFWGVFLKDIYEDNSELIQTGIEEIDQILSNSKQIEEQVNEYRACLKRKVSKHKKLKTKKNNLILKLNELEKQLNSSNLNTIQNEINSLERRVSAISREIDLILSKDDKNALFSKFFENKYLKKAVEQNLRKRKTFLENIKRQKSGLYNEKPSSWTKTAFKAFSILGIVTTGVYIYRNGVPSTNELSQKVNDVSVYVKKNANWKNISNVISREKSNLLVRVNKLWNGLTKENIFSKFSELKSTASEKANYIWSILTLKNISNVISREKSNLLVRVNKLWNGLTKENIFSKFPGLKSTSSRKANYIWSVLKL